MLTRVLPPRPPVNPRIHRMRPRRQGVAQRGSGQTDSDQLASAGPGSLTHDQQLKFFICVTILFALLAYFLIPEPAPKISPLGPYLDMPITVDDGSIKPAHLTELSFSESRSSRWPYGPQTVQFFVVGQYNRKLKDGTQAPPRETAAQPANSQLPFRENHAKASPSQVDSR